MNETKGYYFIFYFFSQGVFVMTAFFPTYLHQFVAGENIQVAGNITGRWRLLITLGAPTARPKNL